MQTLNQRRHLRQPIRTFLYLDFKGSHGAPVLDLSESGVSVVSAVPLTSPKRVFCRLDLTDRAIEAEGVITRADLTGRAGVQFLSMSESDRLQLKEWLFINAITGGVPQVEDAASAFQKAPASRPAAAAKANLSLSLAQSSLTQSSLVQSKAPQAKINPAPQTDKFQYAPTVQKHPEIQMRTAPESANSQAELFPVTVAAAAVTATPELAKPIIATSGATAKSVVETPDAMATAKTEPAQVAATLGPPAASERIPVLFSWEQLPEARLTHRGAILAAVGLVLLVVAVDGLVAWKLHRTAPAIPQVQQATRPDATEFKPAISADIQPQSVLAGRIAGGSVVVPSGHVGANSKLPLVTGIRHGSSPQYTRVTIELQQEVGYLGRRLPNPERIFFDLHNAKLAKGLSGKQFDVNDGVVRRIRVAQYLPHQARIVLDVGDISDYSASVLSNPHRLIIEIHGKSLAKTDKAVSGASIGARAGQAR